MAQNGLLGVRGWDLWAWWASRHSSSFSGMIPWSSVGTKVCGEGVWSSVGTRVWSSGALGCVVRGVVISGH